MSATRLIQLTATEAVAELAKGTVSPLDLVEAAAARIEKVEPQINALPTLCLDRARDHARRLMRERSAERPRGWLGGLPVAIKDLMDVAGVRTTYGSPIFKDHVPEASHPLVRRIESLGGIVMGKSNTPEFGTGGNTTNEVFGQTRNPWNVALTPGGSTGGGAAAVAAGEVWLAHGTDHGGSLRRPAVYCGVAGLRPSPGRVTRGTPSNLFGAQVVQGPIARNVGDLALFLDAMAGFCQHDPLTFDAPTTSFADAVARPIAPRRIAFTADFGGRVAVDREIRELCAKAAARFAELGSSVEEASPEVGEADDAFLALRWHHAYIERGHLLERYPGRIKADVVWNIESGSKQPAERISWAERERAAFCRRMDAFFERYDLLVSPCASTPPWEIAAGAPRTIDGRANEHPGAASLVNSLITLSARPCLAIPFALDSRERPVGLQITGPLRGEAAVLAAGALFEALFGFARAIPIWPKKLN